MFIIQELAYSVGYSINKTVNPYIPCSFELNPLLQVALQWNQPHILPKRKQPLCLTKITNKEELTKTKQEVTEKPLM